MSFTDFHTHTVNSKYVNIFNLKLSQISRQARRHADNKTTRGKSLLATAKWKGKDITHKVGGCGLFPTRIETIGQPLSLLIINSYAREAHPNWTITT